MSHMCYNMCIDRKENETWQVKKKRLIKDTMEQLYVIYYEAVNEGCDGKIVEAYYNQWKGAYKLMNVLGIKELKLEVLMWEEYQKREQKRLLRNVYMMAFM